MKSQEIFHRPLKALRKLAKFTKCTKTSKRFRWFILMVEDKLQSCASACVCTVVPITLLKQRDKAAMYSVEFATWSTVRCANTPRSKKGGREEGDGEPVDTARTAGQPQDLQVHGYVNALSPVSLAVPRSSRFLALILILKCH